MQFLNNIFLWVSLKWKQRQIARLRKKNLGLAVNLGLANEQLKYSPLRHRTAEQLAKMARRGDKSAVAELNRRLFIGRKAKA